MHCICADTTPIPRGLINMASGMENVKKHFLQAFIARKIMRRKECDNMLKQACRLLNVNQSINLYEIIASCDALLEPLGMKIQSGKMEQDGSDWIGLVNTCKDEVVKRSTHLNLAQLEFFKTVLTLITVNDGCVSSGVAICACDSMERKLTKKAAQDLLNDLVKDNWLVIERGMYYIGPRTLVELLPFLDEITGEVIEQCYLCSTRVVMGQRCSDCEKKLHLFCVAKLAKSRSSTSSSSSVVKCPSCHSEWTHTIPVIHSSH